MTKFSQLAPFSRPTRLIFVPCHSKNSLVWTRTHRVMLSTRRVVWFRLQLFCSSTAALYRLCMGKNDIEGAVQCAALNTDLLYRSVGVEWESSKHAGKLGVFFCQARPRVISRQRRIEVGRVCSCVDRHRHISCPDKS